MALRFTIYDLRAALVTWVFAPLGIVIRQSSTGEPNILLRAEQAGRLPYLPTQ